MAQGRNTRDGANSDEEGERTDLHRMEVNLRSLLEEQNQRLIQACNNSSANIDQNAKNIVDLNELVLGLSMQVAKLVSHEGKESAHTSSDTSGDMGNHTPEFNTRTPSFAARMTKVEFPKFDSTKLRSWIYKCNQFFQLDAVSDPQKVRLATIHLEGKALLWHQTYMQRLNHVIPTWQKYTEDITARFGDLFDDPMADLKALRQLGTFQDYHDAFDALTSRLTLSEDYLLSCYLGGLTDEVQLDVRMFAPKSIQQALCLAKLQEAAILANKNKTQQKNPLLPIPSSTKPPNINPSASYKTSTLPYTMTNFTKTRHKCKGKKPQFFHIKMEDEDEDLEVQEQFQEDTPAGETQCAQISLEVIDGVSTFQTMRITGHHGVHWFSQLGPVLWDFSNLTIQFTYNGGKVKLRGITGKKLKELQSQKLNKILQSTGELSMLQLVPVDVGHTPQLSMIEGSEEIKDGAIATLLQSHSSVFTKPQGLPPTRDQFDHKIPLKEGTNAINLRPYRYSIQQKNVIEELVQEMLDQGVIRPSSIPFAAPIVLVKKKDGGWRMCIDYRGLNKVTIKDKFPIPLIEELMDELHGINFFSKIDLKSGYHQIRIMSANSLHANLKKCSFGVSSIHYLGHIISDKGVHTEPDKLIAILSWPTPTNLKQLRGFLGITGYYRRFIQDYGKICRPLTALLKKDAFKWGTEAQEPFDILKSKMTNPPVMALPDFSKPFVIETDASGSGMGAVLMQDGHPITYIIHKWQHYLMSLPFVVRTDQQSLKYLLEHKLATPFQQKWLSKLAGFDYMVEFKSGSENRAADALSRIPRSELLSIAVSSVSSQLMEDLKDHWQTDSMLNKLIADIRVDSNSHPQYTWNQNILMRKGKLVVGADESIKQTILKWMHNSGQGGIVPSVKNASMILQPLPIPAAVWEEVTMDFIEGLPKSKGKEVIMVVIDRLSKFGHFVALQHPFSALTVAQAYLDQIYKLHGSPKSIISDRDKVFTSSFWKEFMKLQGVQLKFSMAYHPQTDGQSKVLNMCLETYLRCMCHEVPQDWAKWLPLAEFWYNSNFHSAINKTPYEVMYNQPPPIHRPYILGSTMLDTIDRIGDWVYLKLQLHRQVSVLHRPNQKLAAKYYGPYEVIKKIGVVAYTLNLPPSAKIHPTFHVSLLKKHHGPPPNIIDQSIPEMHDSSISINCKKPSAVREVRTVKKRNAAQVQWLIQWEQLPIEESTWEEAQGTRKGKKQKCRNNESARKRDDSEVGDKKRKRRKQQMVEESYIAKVKQLVRIKDKQLEDKAAAKLHSFNGSCKIDDNATILAISRRTWQKTQEFLVLGRQSLSELKDKIYCLTDQLMEKAGQHDTHDTSGYFLVEDVFYNDMRDTSAIDYSKPILDWLEGSKKEADEKWEYIISGRLQAKQKANHIHKN
ncbi:hypothetical protein AgCh_014740 [Apium graveolens]